MLWLLTVVVLLALRIVEHSLRYHWVDVGEKGPLASSHAIAQGLMLYAPKLSVGCLLLQELACWPRRSPHNRRRNIRSFGVWRRR
jgi:hypothetical protein